MQNIPDCFRFLFEKYGKDILLNEKKFYALLTDYLPTHEKELKILKIACSAGVYKGFVDLEETRYSIQRKKAIKILTDDYLLGLEWAEMAIDWLMEALGLRMGKPVIKEKRNIPQSKKQSSTLKKLDIEPIQSSLKRKSEEAFDIKNGVLKAYNGTDCNVVIPEGVEKIGKNAFLGLPIKSVVLPNGIIEIGDAAFRQCSELTTISLPNTLQSIKRYAFDKCIKLKDVILPETLSLLGDSCFANCKNISKIVIPPLIERVGIRAFSRCKSLREIRIQRGVKWIGESAFANCSSLATVYLPKSIQGFEKYAFDECGTSRKVFYDGTISDWCNMQSSGAFDGAGGAVDGAKEFYINETIIKHLRIDTGVKIIPKGAFYGYLGLFSVEMAGVDVIDDEAFKKCINLEKVKISNGLQRIGGYAFGYSKIQEIILPSSIQDLGNGAFIDCHNLEEIIIPNSIATIPALLCLRCEKLKRAILSDNATFIDVDAFQDCGQLKEIQVGNKLNTIWEYAFANCENLKDIYYKGTLAEWNSIDFKAGNQCLQNAYIHYNWSSSNCSVSLGYKEI